MASARKEPGSARRGGVVEARARGMKNPSKSVIALFLSAMVLSSAAARERDHRARRLRATDLSPTILPGDGDGDGDVDVVDAAAMFACVGSSGPSVVAGASCTTWDIDGDQDVDLSDAASFWIAFGGTVEVPPVHDDCAAAVSIGEGTRLFDNRRATTDGAVEPACRFGGDSQVGSDVWYCHMAACDGPLTVSTCGSAYDTKLAVYEGCECPAGLLLACSDDDCGAVETIQSRVAFVATAGLSYLIRVGGYLGEQGDGRLTIRCGGSACGDLTQDCFAPSSTSTPGCGDATCCDSVCAVDRFCCDVTWDAACVEAAEGLCHGHFPTCRAESPACETAHAEAGCSTVECCDAVCAGDPYCCLAAWDEGCVNEAQASCFLTCGAGAEDCFAPHATPGCDRDECCRTVCTADPFCCETEWDQSCADSALKVCP